MGAGGHQVVNNSELRAVIKTCGACQGNTAVWGIWLMDERGGGLPHSGMADLTVFPTESRASVVREWAGDATWLLCDGLAPGLLMGCGEVCKGDATEQLRYIRSLEESLWRLCAAWFSGVKDWAPRETVRTLGDHN